MLDLEANRDGVVRTFIDQAGRPDYLFIESQFVLRLYYLDSDEVVEFRGSWSQPIRTVNVTRGIPSEVSQLMTREDRDRIRTARSQPEEDPLPAPRSAPASGAASQSATSSDQNAGAGTPSEAGSMSPTADHASQDSKMVAIDSRSAREPSPARLAELASKYPVTVTDDPFSSFVSYKGSEVNRSRALFSDTLLSRYWISASRDRESGVTTYYVVFYEHYRGGGWRDYSLATLRGGRSLEVEKVKSDAGTCGSLGCSYTEMIMISVPRDVIGPAMDSGLEIKVHGGSDPPILTFSSDYVASVALHAETVR